ncbi:LOW QUALITY PROTEIN: E3 ubiquitin-protein ligase RNF14-like [Dendronephthya gigantea]|uniref:LOW QUALITY PROTEIN: E3 ubiquitin-protein ligase RNF14-like n=1 Tax=Dendronephthya gigantea TaxID=151771 RepID=UPI00106A0AFF|nr:LOW QUALITY PROTEIN: E3 ubiquitin-protein ligase RNF14-like [Dendronephthya gigantea]
MCVASAALLDIIFDFDQKEREQVFKTNHFSCGVCFSEKTGAFCIAFPKCEHVFCTECSEYFKIQIENGSVKALNCPQPKCESQALPSQVKNLVSSDLFAKYDNYLLQSSLDEMSDIVYCPRPTCQSPVILEQNTIGVCEVCRFAFCSLCKLTFHGVSPCVFRPDEVRKLKMEYENATNTERIFLERKYGKDRLRRMIDDLDSEEWLVDNSKICPRCHAHIQKSDGCNKMHCSKCRTDFCWLCGKILDPRNPYLHFNTWESPCFDRLFEGVEIDSD